MSYDSRIYCGDRHRRQIGVFGREGEGPGEFVRLAEIARGPDGMLAAFDLGLERLTFFEADGTRLSETRMPPIFFGQQFLGNRIFGTRLSPPWQDESDQLRYFPMEVDAYSGEVLWEGQDLQDVVNSECFNGILGAPNPEGGLVFRACEHELVFLDHRDADSATVVPSPTYVQELPNERDVDAYLEGVMSIGGGIVTLSPSQKEAYAAGYREDPKGWFLGPHSFRFDTENRLWAATTHDRDTFSYFDIWKGTEYTGTVRIRDRLLGYDILGSTLVALVERNPDQYGIDQQAIDWYDISGVEFGR